MMKEFKKYPECLKDGGRIKNDNTFFDRFAEYHRDSISADPKELFGGFNFKRCNYILVNGDFSIIDGAHRASVLYATSSNTNMTSSEASEIRVEVVVLGANKFDVGNVGMGEVEILSRYPEDFYGGVQEERKREMDERRENCESSEYDVIENRKQCRDQRIIWKGD